MYYDIYIDLDLVGSGLSYGELCQWLLDLNGELNDYDSLTFREDLGFDKGDFEESLYENDEDIEVPKRARFRREILLITESE